MSNTAPEIAASLSRLLVEAKVSIPYEMASFAVEIQEWLDDIAEGRKVVLDSETPSKGS